MPGTNQAPIKLQRAVCSIEITDSHTVTKDSQKEPRDEKIIGSLRDDINAEFAFFRHENAIFLPITIEWQNEKCKRLNLQSSGQIEQHNIRR